MNLNDLKFQTTMMKAQTKVLKCTWSLDTNFHKAFYGSSEEILIEAMANQMTLEIMEETLNESGLAGLFADFDISQIDKIAGVDAKFAKRLAKPNTK